MFKRKSAEKLPEPPPYGPDETQIPRAGVTVEIFDLAEDPLPVPRGVSEETLHEAARIAMKLPSPKQPR